MIFSIRNLGFELGSLLLDGDFVDNAESVVHLQFQSTLPVRGATP